MNRLYGLDFVRGVAAIYVVLYHYGRHHGHDIVPKAWMSVDLFMCISGYVINKSYGGRISEKYGVWDFFCDRVKRLYPVYFICTSVGAIYYILGGAVGCGVDRLEISTFFSALFLLPNIYGIKVAVGSDCDAVAYPLNGPAWSLFFEIVVNIILAVVLRYKFKGNIIFYLALTLLGWIIISRYYGGIGGGWGGGVGVFSVGFFRTLFSFGVGVYLSCLERKLNSNNFIFFMVGALVFLYMLVNNVSGTGLLDIFFIVFVIPVFVWLAGGVALNRRLAIFSSVLGDLSYPLYLIHMPIYIILYKLIFVSYISWPISLGICFFLAVIAAWFVSKLDRFIRAKMHSLFIKG